MFGLVYRCNRCKFDFSSGWSHHEGGLFLICRACAARFVLGGGANSLGPKEGEVLQLFEKYGDGPPTGVTVIAKYPKLPSEGRWDGVFRLVIDDVACPACGTIGSLTQSLSAGEECPSCRDGRIEEGGKCIY